MTTYGSNKIGIGADNHNLYTKADRKRVKKTLKNIQQVFKLDLLTLPWLDIGNGESLMRQEMKKTYSSYCWVTAVNLDIDIFPYNDNTVNTITSFCVLEHIFNPPFHLKECYRILKPSGSLYLIVPNDYSLIYKVEHLLSRKYHPHFHQFTSHDLQIILTLAGFKIKTIKKCFRGSSGMVARFSRNDFLVEAIK